MIYRLSKDGSPLFESTSRDEFLQLCVNYYDEVADDTWEKYEDPSELPGIFEKHGYVYEELPEDNAMTAYSDMLQLFYKLAVWNPRYTFENGSILVTMSQRLLTDYNAQVIAFLRDDTDNPSLLYYLAGDDGLKQWDFHKGFLNSHGVYIY